jgi:hypothetical protein
VQRGVKEKRILKIGLIKSVVLWVFLELAFQPELNMKVFQ